MSVYTIVIGCKLNQAEVLNKLRDSAYTSASLEEADEVWIHTCAVTKEAERKSLKAIRKALAAKKKVYVSGCLAQLKKKEITLNKERITQLDLNQPLPFRLPNQAPRQQPRKARAFVKIQDGCPRACTFCIVPQTRPRLFSRQPADIIKDIHFWIQAGAKEVVLTGACTGLYGLPNRRPYTALSDLLQKIADETPLKRLRLTSFDPRDFTPALLQAFKKISILCPHLHLSIQSGDNAILKSMNRGYTIEEVYKISDSLRAITPRFSLTTDIIVGFPGESPQAFQRTLKAMKRLQLSRCHIFPYSPRPNTKSALLPDSISPQEKKQRGKVARQLASDLERDYAELFLGTKQEVLIDQEQDGISLGYTRTYTYTAVPVPVPTSTLIQAIPQAYASKLYQFKSGGLYASVCAH